MGSYPLIARPTDPHCCDAMDGLSPRQIAVQHGSDGGPSYFNSMAKRAQDLTIAILALLFFGPLMILIACGVALTGPVLFSQERIGRNGQMFRCYKFRTMAVDAEQRLADLLANDPEARREWATMRKLTRDPRITAVGRFLRLSSLDELPQLFNVLRGEMSGRPGRSSMAHPVTFS